jgi:signal peptidase I
MSRKAPQIAGYCLLTYTFLENVCSIRMSNGPSMEPTICPNGDLLIVNRIPNWRKDYKTGDVVLSVSKDNESKSTCICS